MKQAHIPILKCFDDLKFNLGVKTLVDFVKGDLNPTIERNNLDELDSYGCLFMIDRRDLFDVVNILINNDYLEKKVVGGGFEVVCRTSKGLKEMYSREFEPKDVAVKKVKPKKLFNVSLISAKDRKLFEAFDFFLSKFNDEQKQAIVSDNSSVLCVAGAGSGKTTVLTKRVEFLTKFRGVKSSDILAITFTKKAKEEMAHRLSELGVVGVKVETFNSFCEKLLKRYGDKVYDREVKVASFGDKIAIVKKAMKELSINFDIFVDDYFNKRQIREKSSDELFFVFVNDVFSVIDFYKNSNEGIKPFYENERSSIKKRIAKHMFDVAVYVEAELKKKGLRDFTDQIVDCLRLFEKEPSLIPQFSHVLVDEFQDVNKIQVDLLKLIVKSDVFAVGDPRQAIYGWRGSEIEYILDFPKMFGECLVVELKKNYRSERKIVELFNLAISDFGLSSMESFRENGKDKNIFLVEHDSELIERRFVLEAIKNSKNPRCEIFVLARTNKVLGNFADFFAKNGIKYTIKSEEEYKGGEPKEDEVVLATVHSIKGMEAEEVYVVGANSLSYPNRVVDNFVFALMKRDSDYDKEAEEKRLFYVALSRAKSKLVISYTGNLSKFVSSKMLELVSVDRKNKNLFDFASKEKKMLDTGNTVVLKNMLKDWRNSIANSYGMPVYMILSNKTIDEIVMRMPQTKADLERINGFGSVKIAKYGDDILRIIRG